MALTDTEAVRLIGGLNGEDGWRMFRLDTEEELLALIEEHISASTAWLRSRAEADYDQVADTGKQSLFRLAEAYLTLHLLGDNLKARKVYGTHWAVDSEDSSSYEQLIETEWLGKVEFLVGHYFTIETGGTAFAAPVMVIGAEIMPSDIQTIEEELDDILAASWGIVLDEVAA